jgi:hypothetical protein
MKEEIQHQKLRKNQLKKLPKLLPKKQSKPLTKGRRLENPQNHTAH